ncbi:hypothetical protein HK101_010294, partial [Irineochytrium annulatum]
MPSQSAAQAGPDYDPARPSYAPTLAGLALAESIHGLYPVVAKLAFSGTERIHPVLFVLARSVIATPILLLVASLIDNPPSIFPRTREEWSTSLFLGLTGISLNQLANAAGVALTSPFNVSIWQQLIPAFTLLLSLAFRGERVTLVKAISVALCFVGAYVILTLGQGGRCGTPRLQVKADGPRSWGVANLVVTAEEKDHDDPFWWAIGNLMLLTNCASFAIYLLLSSDARSHSPTNSIGAITLSSRAHLGGLILGLPTTLILSLTMDITTGLVWPWTNLGGARVWAAVAYAGILSSGLAYTLLLWASGRVPPPTVAIFVPLQTVVAGVFGR